MFLIFRTPTIHFDSNCIVGLADLHNHAEIKRHEKEEMDRQAYKHFRWYNAMLQDELYSAPTGFKLQILHWTIETDNINAFRINNNTFDAVTMIIGPNIEHWFGAIFTLGRKFCAHGHNQRISTVKFQQTPSCTSNSSIILEPYDLITHEFTATLSINTTKSNNSNFNTNNNEKDHHQSLKDNNNTVCNPINYYNENNIDDDGSDDCQDIFMLKITLAKICCPKRARNCHLKFINSMITINEE